MRKKILVIEDNEIVLECMALLFQQEYEVLGAHNGREGIELARTCLPDLIMSDLNMNGFDGLEVAEALRKEPTTARIPFVLITAAPEADLQQQCTALGVDRLLRKPFDPDVLARTVSQLLPGRPHEPSLIA